MICPTLDASQNAQGKSIASVYSVRPMPGAPVSTPLHWDEVNEKLAPSTYTMQAVLDRLDRHGDLYGVCSRRSSASALPYGRSRADAGFPAETPSPIPDPLHPPSEPIPIRCRCGTGHVVELEIFRRSLLPVGGNRARVGSTTPTEGDSRPR